MRPGSISDTSRTNEEIAYSIPPYDHENCSRMEVRLAFGGTIFFLRVGRRSTGFSEFLELSSLLATVFLIAKYDSEVMLWEVFIEL
eukprot:CAMPEP_0170495652 /NCGR_PEP_ID=MMETSP0208-20121228/17928_1 /TAXON_ID=197538 /ORGANISM="Strombidium inclinatum, Strain S3" /LENGTH=85 /DNA_ID=CAMNT_0010771963 /DNA_START=1159 /DNA_END=1416 /DNA_ORIENTATION=-